MKSLKGSGVRSGSGVNKAASAWAGDIRRAAKRMGVNVTSGDVGNIISLIQHESGGNAGITQSSSPRHQRFTGQSSKRIASIYPTNI